jgi:hypothetical protein
MPGKKSMKSSNVSSSKDMVEKKPINQFYALLASDDDDTEQEEKIETKTSTVEETKSLEVVEQTGETEQTEKTEQNEDQMLNVGENVKVSDFISVSKPRRERDNRDHRDNREHRHRSDIRYDEKVLEQKQIYDENTDYGNIGNDLKLNSQWTVWVHKYDNSDWTLHSYQKRYIINSIGSFWRFFNNFQFYDCYKNQLFIMRGEIAPIWEDVNNKFGGICSIKVDSTQRGFKTDISTEIFITTCMLIMNETFIANNEDINGISYNVKKRGILIKVWTKTYHKDDKFINELPKTLINKFNSELQKQLNGILGDNYKMSIQYKQIKPEYEL